MDYRESTDSDFSQYLLTVTRHWVTAASIFVITVTLAAFSNEKKS